MTYFKNVKNLKELRKQYMELKTEICKGSDKLLFDYLEHGEN